MADIRDESDVSLTVQDSQLAAKWTEFLQDYYGQEIQQAALAYPDVRSVVVAFEDIQKRDPELADYLLQRPKHALRVGETSLFGIDVTVEAKPRLRLRVAGLPPSAEILIRDLRVDHLSRFTCLHGIVNRATPVRPQVLEAAFECKSCGNLLHVVQEEDHRTEPVMCDACEKSGSIWRLDKDQSRMINVQRIRLQEVADDIKGSVQPEDVTVYLRDDLVQTVSLGDRIKVNGLLVPETRRAHNKELTIMEKVFEANHVEPQARAFDDIPVTVEDEEELRELVAGTDVVAWWRDRFAPHLYGLDDAKDACVLSLFGGTRHVTEDGEIFVGDIHVLVCGDPSTGKTQLLNGIKAVSPRAVMTGGAATTGAGLGGGLVKDSFDKDGMSLEAGALQKAHRGHLLIDEWDKLEKEDWSMLLLAMSIGKVLFTKVGIVSHESPAECGIIGACNPKGGRFDDRDPIAPQIGMRPEMLSRFAAVFALLDKPNEERDKARVRHRRDRALGGAQDDGEDESSLDLMRKWVAHARRRPAPKETDEQWDVLEQAFESLRRASLDHIIIDDRTLDNMRRFSQASARMRLADEVSAEDAQRAVELVMSSLQSVATDPRTGALDLDYLTTNKHRVRTQQEDRDEVLRIIQRLCLATDKGYVHVDDVVEAAEEAGVKPDRIEWAIQRLRDETAVYAKGGSQTLAPMR